MAQACDYVRQAALGLQHAHERGLVHRDVKPRNLLLATADGTVKVLDFGLAALTGDGGRRPAEHGLAGTRDGHAGLHRPGAGRDAAAADIRADIYSLGCTLYYLLTGQPPFPGGTVMQKLLAHQDRRRRPVARACAPKCRRRWPPSSNGCSRRIRAAARRRRPRWPRTGRVSRCPGRAVAHCGRCSSFPPCRSRQRSRSPWDGT